ncbi:unnamed protein product [Schistocephalus solidus]|uniref:Small ribosomal subunit protein uS5m n=1 Tax=Schistocephalus solidus TaxID=70667 RepID=A0A183TCD6_SCHSO|nr:unnamed protein product [Schistocephalus solidus]
MMPFRLFSQSILRTLSFVRCKTACIFEESPKYPSTYRPFNLTPRFSSPINIPTRQSTIFTSLPSDVIWEGVTGPKGSTKKRARGKRRVTRPKIDLNRGQRIGENPEGYLWPGLNAPLYDQSVMRTIQKGDVNEVYLKRLDELRNKSAVKKKRIKLPPLLRGWTGASMGGQSLGSLEGGSEDFDTRVLEFKAVSTMTATVGRYRRFSALVAAGNGHGVCGIGRGKSVTMRAALKRAKHRAFLNLMSFNLRENRTRYGLICHRVIKTLCQIIGVKDLHAKVEGNTKNYLAIVRGFLRLLHEQETYDEVSNRLGLHVVEFDKNYNMVPQVLASPSSGITRGSGLKTDPLLRTRSLPAAPKCSRITTDLASLYNFWKASKKPPILEITNPACSPRIHQKPDQEYDPLNNLVDAEDEEVEESVTRLLERGERDLDTLVTLKGLVLNIKPNTPPYYLNSPGVLKRQAERYRYRNQDSAQRERLVCAALDKQKST